MSERRKKVLFLVTKSNFGGAQRYVFELATGLPNDRYDVVVAFGGGGLLKEKLEAAGVRTHTIKSMGRDVNVLKELRSMVELWQLYRSEQPDIVHLNSSKAVALGALIGRLSGLPLIVSTIHGWPFLEQRSLLWRTAAWLASWISALLAHKVILVSEHDRTRFMPLARHKFSTIHTSVPTFNLMDRAAARNALFDAETIAAHESHAWVVSIAELTPNKNLDASIDAIAIYNRSSASKVFYTILGDGEQMDGLHAQILDRGASDHIVLKGYVDNARQYLDAFDIFLLTSKKEGLPYVILEAGAAGLPVVASKVGGIPEVIRHEETGLLVDPNDQRGIAKAIERFVADPSLRTQCAQALKARVASSFSLERMLAETRAVYEM